MDTKKNQAHPAPTEQHRSPARSLAALHRSPASRTALEHPLQDANSRTDIENGHPANHLENKTWQPWGTPEGQPHVVVVLGFNTDSFAISKSIKKGNEGAKMNIYESFLLLSWARGTARFPLISTLHIYSVSSRVICWAVAHKMQWLSGNAGPATSREVTISLSTCVPNATARGVYLEINPHVLSFAGAGKPTARVNYPCTCLIAMLWSVF